jgi:DNA-binding NtrC family response regulator
MIGTNAERKGLKELMTEYERDLIVAALTASGGNQRRAAAMLGVLPTTLHEKMKRLGLIQRREEAAPAPIASAPYAAARPVYSTAY